MKIRYHFDEHIDPDVAAGVRRRGIDALTTFEAGLVQATDEEQLAFATSASRVLVTRDQDFLALHAREVPHAGIVFWHSKRRSIGGLVHQLTRLWRTTPAEEIVGQALFF